MYSVSLRFFGDDLDPDKVSRLLGSPPTDSARRGDLVQLRTRSFTAPSGSWRLSTEQSTDDIETQLVAMFGRLTDHLSVWQSLTSRFDADLFCKVFLFWLALASPHGEPEAMFDGWLIIPFAGGAIISLIFAIFGVSSILNIWRYRRHLRQSHSELLISQPPQPSNPSEY